jgi:hypothetical protein
MHSWAAPLPLVCSSCTYIIKIEIIDGCAVSKIIEGCGVSVVVDGCAVSVENDSDVD